MILGRHLALSILSVLCLPSVVRVAAVAAEQAAAEESPLRQRPVMGRDPFRPFTLDFRVQRPPEGPLTPLQRYELGQLKLVGVVVGVDPPRAMVEDSSGMGYLITIGTPVGRNGGVVKAIEAGRVVVEERLFDFYGREQISRVTLTVPADDASPVAAGKEGQGK